MKIIFYGARQAGMFSLLTLLAAGEDVICLIPERKADKENVVEKIGEAFKLYIFKPESINSEDSINHLKSLKPDLLVCCHGRDILKKDILNIPKFGCINLHPCLYKYKGARPITRLLEDKETKASVAAHYMTEKIDEGETIVEKFVDIACCKTEEEVYNVLYLYYSLALLEALERIKSKQY